MSARDVSCGPSLNCPVMASVCRYRYCPSLSVFLYLSFFICLSGFLWCWHRVPDLCGRRRTESGQYVVNKAKMRQCRDEAGLRGQVADIIAALE